MKMLGRRGVIRLSAGLVGLCLVLKALSVFDERVPGGALLAALQFQYVWGVLAGVSGLLAMRAWTAAGWGALPLLWCSLVWLPEPAGPLPPAATGWTSVKLVSANVMNNKHTHPAAFVEYAKTCGADVIGLQEIQGDFWAGLIRRELGGIYPYQHFHAGVGVISRLPLKDHHAVDLGEPGREAISVVLARAEGSISLLIVHPNRPRWRETQRNASQLARLAEVAAALPAPAVVMGDFNASPWNASLVRIARQGGLRIATTGARPPQTYAKKGNRRPWSWYYRLAGVPIDHALVSPDIAVTTLRAGPHHGSDHLPLEVVLNLARR